MSGVNLFFFRHGETDFNKGKIVQGQCGRSALPGIHDLGLNATGQQQADRLAVFLRDNGVALDVVFSSDLLRAAETGQVVAAAYGVELIPSKGLREMFFGTGNEGLPVEDFKKMTFDPPLVFPGATADETIQVTDGAMLRDYHKSTDPRYDHIAHPGGESKIEVRERAVAAIDAFVAENPQYKNIGIPTHNGLLRFVMPALEKVAHTECVHVIYHTEARRFEIIARMKPSG